jgi:DNA-binding LacI/PurR family transcriptional regulator
MPGAVAVGPPESRFSAVAFRSGGPDALLAELVEAGAVVVTLDYLADVEGVDSVAVDCDKEADAGIEFLGRLGHRYIGYLAPRFGSSKLRHWTDNIDPDCRRFSQAMLRAKQRMGLNGSPVYHVECDMDPANSDMAVWGAIDRLWRLKPRPTALICFDPRLAQQAKAVLQLRQVDCPADASIVVRDLLRTGEPPFTTLASDPRRMGTSAAEHVINRLTYPNVAPTRLLFASRLIEGATTAPAPMATALAAGA